MDYVVNPMWIYLISVLYGVDTFFTCSIAISLLMSIILVVCIFADLEEENDIKKSINVLKVSIISCFLSSMIVIAIPSKKTMYAMITAKFVTYENINKTKETGKEIVDYIFERIDNVKED